MRRIILYSILILSINLVATSIYLAYPEIIGEVNSINNMLNTVDLTRTVILILFLVNIFQFMTVNWLIKWRRRVSQGMEAVVPVELLKSFQEWQKFLNKRDGHNQNVINDIEKSISKFPESLEILKKELESKEQELKRLSGLSESLEKGRAIKKLTTLHSKFSALEEQSRLGKIELSVALDFLKEDIADVFEEIGIEIISPNIGTSIKDLISDEYIVQSELLIAAPELDLTIAKLVSVGYLQKSLTGNPKVIKSAVIILNKFGG